MEEEQQDRRENGEWFRALMEAMNEGLGIVDAQGVITYANPALCAMWGYTPAQLRGHPVTRFFTDENRTLVLEHLEGHAHGNFDPFEIGFTRPDGRTLVLHISPRALPTGLKRYEGAFAVISDVTERRRTEEQLRKLSVALEQSPVGIMITDTSGTIEYVNRSLCEMTGYSAEELVGQNPRLLQSGLTPQATYRSLWSSLLRGNEWRGELRDKKKNGELYWGYDVISPIKDQNNTITHFVALQEDITARKRVEDALRESEMKYSLLVESSLTGIYIIQDGRFVYANSQCAAMLGYHRDELLGMEILQLIAPQDRQRIANKMERILAGKKEANHRLTNALTANGDTILLKQGWVGIEYHGKPAILGNAVDITQEKRIEERLAKSTRQLQVLSQQLLDVLELERKRVAAELHDGIGQYLSALKFSLLNATPEACQSELAAGRPPPCSELIPMLQEAIEEVRRISADLRPATLDDLGLVATISWFCRRAQMLYPQLTVTKHVEIQEADVPETLKLVIFRVLQEALNNAAKHAGASAVQIRLEKTAAKLALTITDNGKGFDVAQELGKKSTERGFGLISMQQRVRFSGGQFAVDSSPGHGTAISAYWPIATPGESPGSISAFPSS